MAEEHDQVTGRVSAEAAQKIPTLVQQFRNDAERDLDGAYCLADQFTKIAEMRVSYFEKIILLAGGSFALSLTFLGSLQRHNAGSPVRALWSLELSWILLLVAIFLSWLHNRHRGFVIESLTFSVAARATSYYENQRVFLLKHAASVFKGVEIPDLDLSGFFFDVSKLSTKASVDAEGVRDRMGQIAVSSWTMARKLGDGAMLSIGLAFILMLCFAMRNVALL
jgi:hypothetical protein